MDEKPALQLLTGATCRAFSYNYLQATRSNRSLRRIRNRWVPYLGEPAGEDRYSSVCMALETAIGELDERPPLVRLFMLEEDQDTQYGYRPISPRQRSHLPFPSASETRFPHCTQDRWMVCSYDRLSFLPLPRPSPAMVRPRSRLGTQA